MPETISTHGLTRRYGVARAVDHLHLTCAQGERSAFPESSGAGTATLVRRLTGLIRPTEGVARAEGCDARAAPTAIKACVTVSSHGEPAGPAHAKPAAQGWRST